MYVNIGRSLSTDYFLIADQLMREELSYLQRTRDLSTTRCCRSSTALGAGGVPVAGGGEARQARDRGRRHPWLVHMELNRGDGSLGTFVGVHAGRVARRHPQRAGVGRPRARNSGVRGRPEVASRWLSLSPPHPAGGCPVGIPARPGRVSCSFAEVIARRTVVSLGGREGVSQMQRPSSHLLPARSAMADEAAGSGCHPVAASVDD